MASSAGGLGEGTPPADRTPLEELLRGALENDGFVLYAQPILNLKTLRFDQYELLLRLVDDRGRLVLPRDFLDVARRAGLIRSIDGWVLRRAIHLLARQAAQPGDLVLEVNLAGPTVTDEELSGWIQRQLAAEGVQPAALVLEITETSAIPDLGRAQRFIEKLRALGCRFALDDFGVGFSSFHYLKHLPVDYVKIDGSFVRNLTRNRADAQIVKAVVEVAAEMGIQTVAECVEDRQTLEQLRRLGVDFAQGYYVGPPVPLSIVAPEASESSGTPEGLPG